MRVTSERGLITVNMVDICSDVTNGLLKMLLKTPKDFSDPVNPLFFVMAQKTPHEPERPVQIQHRLVDIVAPSAAFRVIAGDANCALKPLWTKRE